VTEPGPATVAAWMARACELEPASVDGVAYGLPALIYRGKPLVAVVQTAAGYSVYPFSGAVVTAVAPLLGDLKRSKGAIAFTDALPLPREAFDALVRSRRAEIDASLDG
jgi:uncharacterized protein YdhG (YjbR/CyaY superfamily)